MGVVNRSCFKVPILQTLYGLRGVKGDVLSLCDTEEVST